MKKYFKGLLVALAAAVMFAALGLAACNETAGYNISVTCGDGGGYTLSHENPVPENTQVTLTVTPDDGYTVGDVLIDGSKISLVGNRYIFTVTGDVSVSISFESESVLPEECSITVNCGAGGGYELSPASGFHAGDSVRLTLKPDSGYRAGEVKVNGEAVPLNGNAYEWTLEGDATVEIAFVPVDYSVTVYCGYGGSYALSPAAGPYHTGDEVTLTVTPNEDHSVKSVTVNGADVTAELDGGEYAFTVSSDVEISIEFSSAFSRDAYVGTWTSIVSAGTVPDELVIDADGFTFNGKSYPLTETESGYSFTATEDGDVYRYSFTLEEVGEEKYILVLTVEAPEATLTQYCTKEGVDYSVSFPAQLQGDWDAGPANYPINIGENKMTIGSDTAIVLFYSEQSKTYMLLSGGTQYTLVWNEADETLTLTIVGDAETAAVYTKAIPPEEAFFTQFAGNYYTNGEHTVEIGGDGAFSFDGAAYSVIPVDSSDPSFGYTFRKNGELWHIIIASAEQFLITDPNYSDEIVCRRVTGEEAYTITVTYTDGENGTCTITPPAKGDTYAAYEEVTVTITANAGYHLEQVYLNKANNITAEFEDGSYTFYISRNTEIEIKFISEAVAESIFPTDFIGKIFYAEDLSVFSVKFEYDKVTLTIESVEYVFTVDEITVTDSASATFAFNVTIETYGVVTVQCERRYGFANFTVSRADGTVLGRTFTDKAA